MNNCARINDVQIVQKIKDEASATFKRLDLNKNNEFKFMEDGLYCYDQKIANVVILPKRVIDIYYFHSEKENKMLELQIIFAELDEVIECEIELSGIRNINYQEVIDHKICLSYSMETEKASREVYKLIQRLLPETLINKRIMIEKLGWLTIGDKHIYNAGNMIIGSLEKEIEVCCSKETQRYMLEYPYCPNDLRKQKITRLIKAYSEVYKNKGEIILFYLILGLLRSLYFEAGVDIKCCLMIVGENQSYKTTIASYGCSIYNRLRDVEYNVHNLTGTEAKLMKQLDIEKDMVCIIDDLNKSDSRAIERKQTGMISNIIRVAANNRGRETMQNEYEINTQALFCAEYPLENQSTNNRLIVLQFHKEDIDKLKLKMFEECSEYLGLFVEEFISWVIKNYDKILSELAMMKAMYLEIRKKEEAYQERLQKNYWLLSTAYQILNLFLEENHIDNDLDEDRIICMLNNAMTEQIEYLEMDGKEEVDYIKEIFVALKDDWDIFVYEDREEKKDVYYNKKKEQIYIPGDVLSELYEIKNDKCVKAYEIVKQFRQQGLLVVDNNKNKSLTKKINGKRAYCIEYDEWKCYIKDNYCNNIY